MAYNTVIGSDNWEKGEVLRLIELYEQETVLWNIKLSAHRNSNTRHDAINKISMALGRNDIDVDKKIKNLRSQFFREKNKKTKNQKSGAGTDEVYVPKWMFYKHLQFLSPSVEPVSHSSSMNLNLIQDEGFETTTDDIVQDGTELDIHDVEEDSLTEMRYTPITEKRSIIPTNSSQSDLHIASKKSKTNKSNKIDGIEKKINEAFEVMKCSANKKKDQDTCFGEFISESLRNITDLRIKSWARKEISNIIFQAETLTYGQPLTPTSNSSSSSQGPQTLGRGGYQSGPAASQHTQKCNQNTKPINNFKGSEVQFNTSVGQQTSCSRGKNAVNAGQQQHYPNSGYELSFTSQGDLLNIECLRPNSIEN